MAHRDPGAAAYAARFEHENPRNFVPWEEQTAEVRELWAQVEAAGASISFSDWAQGVCGLTAEEASEAAQEAARIVLARRGRSPLPAAADEAPSLAAGEGCVMLGD